MKDQNTTLYLKVRKSAIPHNQPLESEVGTVWILQKMQHMGMVQPEVLSVTVIKKQEGIKVLYATIKFKSRDQTLVGTYLFFNKRGKRFFIAGYSDSGFESLDHIKKSLTFKL